MIEKLKTLIILSPAFASEADNNVMPSQEILIKSINRNFPGLEVIILSFHFPSGSVHEYQWCGNKVIAFGGGMKGGFHSILLWLKVWKCLKELKKLRNPIGILSFFCSESAFVGHYFSWFHRIKHFIWILGQDAKKENTQVARIRPKPNELIAISDFVQETFEVNHRIRPSRVITIGIDYYKLPDIMPERKIDLLGAGSLIKLKQYDKFIKVVELVSHSLPNVKAKIIGNGPEEPKLISLIEELKLDNHISFSGKKESHAKSMQAMMNCKIFLHTSSYEGFGAVCIEALYAGAHVVSFCKPMNVTIPNWHIVSNEDEMAAKVIELLSHPKTIYSSTATYDVDESAKAMINLYDYSV